MTGQRDTTCILNAGQDRSRTETAAGGYINNSHNQQAHILQFFIRKYLWDAAMHDILATQHTVEPLR